MRPLPHRVTVKRETQTFNATTGAPIAKALVTVYSAVKALISPESTSPHFTPFGPAETQESMIFFAALDGDDNAYTIRYGDTLVDDQSGEIWIAVNPGHVFQKPTGFSSGVTTKDHIEVKVRRADIEAAGI